LKGEPMKDKLLRLDEIRKEITKLYTEKISLETEIGKYIKENGENWYIDLDEKYVVNAKEYVEKDINFEMLKEKYPDVYELGLITSFNLKTALNSIDYKLFNEILKDCSTFTTKYKVSKERKNGYGKKRYKR
jgi:predicted phage-related endonuclease